MKKFISRGMVLVLAGMIFCSAILIFFISPKINLAPQEVSANSLPMLTKKQFLNGVDENFTVDVIATYEINDDNINDYVKVQSDSQNINIQAELKKSHVYTIKARGKYEKGKIYSLKLSNGTEFADEYFKGREEIGFSIHKNPVEKLEYKSSNKTLNKEQIVDTQDEYIIVNSGQYSIGDIILVPTKLNGMDMNVSHKVEDIEHEGGNTRLCVSTPNASEVFDELDIYGEYDYDENLIQLNEDAIIEEASKMSEIRATSTVLDSAPKFSIHVKSYKPIDFYIEIKWSANLNKKNQPVKNVKGDFTADIAARLYFSINIEAFNNVTKDSSLNIVLIETAVRYEKTIGVSGNFSVDTDWGDKTSPKYNDKKTVFKDSQGNKIKYKTLESEANGATRRGQTPTVKRVKHKGNAGDRQREDNKLRAKKTKQIQELINIIKQNEDERTSAFKICSVYFPIVPGVFAIKFDVEVFVELNFKIEAGMTYILKMYNETGTYTEGNEVKDINNFSISYSALIFIRGELDFRMGVRFGIGINLISVIDIQINIESGLYLKMNGILGIKFSIGDVELIEENTEYIENNSPPDTPIDAVASAQLDAGYFIRVKGTVKLNLWLFEIKLAESVFWDNKISFFPKRVDDIKGIGNNVFHDIIYERTIEYKNTTQNPEETLAQLAKEEVSELEEMSINDEGFCVLPKFYLRSLNIDTQQMVNKQLAASELLFSESEYVYFKDGGAFLKDSSIIEFEEMIYVTTLINGEIDPTSVTSFIIKRDPVKVSGIKVKFDKEGIQSGGYDSLRCEITPVNASYQEVKYSVEYVVVSGQKIFDCANYSYFNHSALYATKRMSVGDKIGVKVTAIADNVSSDIFEVDIVKTPVDSVRILAQDFRRDIQIGEQIQLRTVIYPLDATFPTAKLQIVEGREYGEILSDGLTLQCFDTAPLNKQIKVQASVDGKSSDIYVFNVGAIPVESVNLCADDQKLDQKQKNGMQIGSTAYLKAICNPINATTSNQSFTITKGFYFATIDNDGILQINKDAKIGEEIKVIGSLDGVNSKEYVFVIEKVPVEKVNIFTQGNVTSMQPSQSLQFLSSVEPINATYVSVDYIIKSGQEYAHFDKFNNLIISSDAPVYSKIEIVGMTEGIESQAYEITVDKIPVEHVNIFINDTTIIEGSSVQIINSVFPFTASFKDIGYTIISGNEYASISRFGVVTVNDNIQSRNAKVKIQGNADGVLSNTIELDIYVPVKKTELATMSGETDMQIYQSTKLQVDVYPHSATNQNVQYIITTGYDYATIQTSLGYLTINSNAKKSDIIKVIAIVDGVKSNEITINIVPTPVEDIIIDMPNIIDAPKNREYYFKASVVPSYATDTKITYEMLSGGNFAKINNTTGSIFVLKNSPLHGIIDIVAKSGNVQSEIFQIRIVDEPITNVNIFSVDGTLSLMQGKTTQLGVSMYPVPETPRKINYKIISNNEYAKIDDTGLFTAVKYIEQFSKISIIAEIDAVQSSSFTITITKIPVKTVDIINEERLIFQGKGLQIDSSVHPQNATYSNVAYNIIAGAQYAYVSADGYLQINDYIPIGNACIGVQAVADGVISSTMYFDVYTPISYINIQSSSHSILSSKEIGESIKILYEINHNATNSEVQFIACQGNEYIDSINQNIITVKKDIKNNKAKIVIQAIADGTMSNTLEFSIYIPIDSIDIASETDGCVERQQSYSIKAVIHPEYATNTKHKLSLKDDVFASITENGVLDIKQDAMIGGKIQVVLKADDYSKNAEFDFTIIPTYATGLSIASVKNNKNAIVNSNNKALPNEALSFDVEFDKLNTTYKDFSIAIVGGNVNCGEIIDNKLYIKSTNQMTADNPYIIVRATSTQNGKLIVNNQDYRVDIYVPVQSFTLQNLNINRGEWSALNFKFNQNGFATNKSIYFTTNDSNVDFDGNYILVPKHYTSGKTIHFTAQSVDNRGLVYSFTVTVSDLNINNYNISFSLDSEGRVINEKSPQLEENHSVNIVPRYNEFKASDYGINFNYSSNANSTFIGVVNGTEGKLSILQHADGKSYVTIYIDFIDGAKNYRLSRHVRIFNRLNSADQPTIAYENITTVERTLYITALRSSSTARTSDFRYKHNTPNTFLSTTGALKITKQSPFNIYVTIYCEQVYNNTTIYFSRNILLKNQILTHSSTNLNNSEKYVYDTGNTYTNSVSSNLYVSQLLQLGYTKVKIDLYVEMKEVNFGFQILRFHTGGNIVWQDSKFEHGGTALNKNYLINMFSFKISLSTLINNRMHMSFSAGGCFADTWIVRDVKAYFQVS